MGDPFAPLNKFVHSRSGRWLTAVAAVALGGLYSTAFAPLSLKVPGFIGLTAGLVLMAAHRSAWPAFFLGFLFALGAFVPGLSWTVRSMAEFGRIPMPVALLGLVALAALCALFWAVAAAVTAKFCRTFTPRLLGLAGALTVFEWLRGSGFADFGWLTPALATLDTAFTGFAPLGGGHLVNLMLLLSLAGFAAALIGRARRQLLPTFLLALPAVLIMAGIWSGAHTWSEPAGKVNVRLVQANLPVVDGWTRASAADRLDVASELMRTPWDAEVKSPRLVLTAEGIISSDILRLNQKGQEALEKFLESAGGPVLFNGFRRDENRSWLNSSFLVEGATVAVTDKRKLVPFGEYVPPGFRWFVDAMGIPLTDLTAGGFEQTALPVAGIRAGILICYENLDGEVLRSLWRDPEAAPNLLVVTANLGWFSPSIIPQHLDMTRLLAIASARPAASVNMSGRSALIDEKGRRIAQAPVKGAAVLTREISVTAGSPTPFIRFGDVPALILAVLTLLGCAVYSRKFS